MSVLDKLTEGIVDRDLSKEGAALNEKWEATGLLEGLTTDREKDYMSRLLENQAKELLREASSMAGGDVEGFAAVAFPIVRRVFGGLIANELVSVQPMSLPSGLIFFLDFQHNSARAGMDANDSIYGGGVLGSQLTGGVSLTGDAGEQGFYNLSNGYSSPTASATISPNATANQGTVASSGSLAAAVRYDPDLLGKAVVEVTCSSAPLKTEGKELNEDNLITITTSGHNTAHARLVRRLTSLSSDGNTLTLVYESVGGSQSQVSAAAMAAKTVKFAQTDDFDNGSGLGSVVGGSEWGLEGANDTGGSFNGSNTDAIPEIDIKVDSIAVTAITKKLKAKWTPELGQDLNAYHNLDAEVELTSVLSETIALEIDQEILNDLVKGAKAGTYHWSRRPGKFMNRSTGEHLGGTTANIANEALFGGDFTGNVAEWNETLIHTINDLSAVIHRKTLRGGGTFIVCGPETANILEATTGFRANVTADTPTGTVGAVNVGSLSKKYDVMVDPYFPRNVILLGRRGNNFLESGYVYAPYVPLQVTPTIFGPEDFVPRKGVMTRYAKKMVRPDMYGLVVIHDLLG